MNPMDIVMFGSLLGLALTTLAVWLFIYLPLKWYAKKYWSIE